MGKIQSFGHHLRAHQDVELAVCKCPDESLVAVAAAGGVGVHAGHSGIGEMFRQLFLNAFGAEALGFHGGFATGNAHRRRWIHDVAAVVAVQFVFPFVNGQRNVAALAFRNPRAGLALPHGAVATSVLEQNDLAPGLEHRLHLQLQQARKMAEHGALPVGLAQVGAPNFRQHYAAITLVHLHTVDAPLGREPMRLHGRRR